MGDRSSTPSASKSFTDFVPGSLDQSSLPMLEPPSYATPNATKSLNRALKEVLDIQKKTPLHELGWYIDQELINNIYQWIVELHSFDPKLPLTKDMKAAGLTSVVLEIRFGKDYPFSPPFVRVIRPRFLPFMSGGGGHVYGTTHKFWLERGLEHRKCSSSGSNGDHEYRAKTCASRESRQSATTRLWNW